MRREKTNFEVMYTYVFMRTQNYATNHEISKLVVWRSKNPAIQSQSPLFWGVQSLIPSIVRNSLPTPWCFVVNATEIRNPVWFQRPNTLTCAMPNFFLEGPIADS